MNNHGEVIDITKGFDFRNKIKDLSGGVKPTANLLILLYYIKVNDYKHLHTTVKVHAKSLFLLYYTLYRKKSNKFKHLHSGVKAYCNLLFYIVYTLHGARGQDEVLG